MHGKNAEIDIKKQPGSIRFWCGTRLLRHNSTIKIVILSQLNRNFNYIIFLKRSLKTCCKWRVSGLFLIWALFREVRVNWDLADLIFKAVKAARFGK